MDDSFRGDTARLAEENWNLRRSADVITDHAHAHAYRAAELELERDELLRRHEVELAAARGELAAVEATLEAAEGELARLRAIPELRVGQRIRSTADRVVARVHRPDDQDADGDLAAVDEPEGSTGAEMVSAAPTDTIGPPPVVIIVRDRLSCLEELVVWLEDHGVTDIHLVDNASTFPPLVEYLDASRHKLWRLGTNLGHRAPWAIGLVAALAARTPFVVTDPDVIPDDGCPDDVFEHLAGILDRHPDLDKVGLGIRIDDLPAHAEHRDDILAWEGRNWEHELEPGVFGAAVDTTFALYRANTAAHHPSRAARTGAPYVARHLPWYDDPAQRSAEEQYYRDHLDPAVNTWNRDEIPAWFKAKIDAPDRDPDRA